MATKTTTNTRQEIKITRLNRDFDFPAEAFIPIKSGEDVDSFISRKGGTMPATITVVVGEGGSGKTTYLINKMAKIIDYDNTRKCLYVSAEMTSFDNKELSDELPQLLNLDTFYLSDYDNPMEAMEDVLKMGWDYVIIDSFSDVKDKIKESDTCKMAASSIESWLLKLMTETCMGANDENKFTAFDVILHITKGGTYTGSTKLKHNTTAMLYVKVDKKTDERYLVYDKNRRGGTNKKLVMGLVDGDIVYNTDKFHEEYGINLVGKNLASRLEFMGGVMTKLG
jgi:predicted ATP-dependent serine protease